MLLFLDHNYLRFISSTTTVAMNMMFNTPGPLGLECRSPRLMGRGLDCSTTKKLAVSWA